MERFDGRRAVIGLALTVGAIGVGNASMSNAGAAMRTANTPAISSNIGFETTPIDLISAQDHWQLDGVTQDTSHHQLDVRATGLSIVKQKQKQNGSPGYTEVPMNLYGTRLQTNGNFSVTIGTTSVNGTAEINLDGQPPLVEDEFLAQEDTLAMQISGRKFTANISNQIQGINAGRDRARIEPSTNHTVTVTDSAGRLSFVVDGKAVRKKLPDRGIFNSHTVWFGMDALSPGGSFAVNQLTAAAQLGSSVGAVDTRNESITLNPNGFAALAQKKRPGFYVGAAVALGPMVADPTYRLNLGNFNDVSIENAGKFQTTEPMPGYYNFTEEDAIVDMARAAGMRVHGHAILFSEALPAWVQALAETNPSQLQQVMVNYITTVMTHYKGKIASYDFNELLADYGTTPGQYGLRQNIWYKAMGPEYIVTALKAAHAADPSAEIYFNDFGMESDTTRFGQMENLIKYVQTQGVKPTGVGFEAHIDSGDTNAADTHINIPLLEGRFQVLQSLGLKARISELDVSSPSEYPVYGDAATACINSPNCVSLTTWGVSDNYSSGGSVGPSNIYRPYLGLLFNANGQPTPGVNYFAGALK